jgi:WD40 repeat protein
MPPKPLWSIPALESEFPLSDDTALGVDFSADGKGVLISTFGDLTLYDAKTGREVRSYKPIGGVVVWCGRPTPDGRHIIEGTGEGVLKIWDAKSAKLKVKADTVGIVMRLSISRDGTRALTATGNKDVRLWDVLSGRTLGGFTMKKSFTNGAVLHPDRNIAACGGTDGVLRFFDAISGVEQKAVPGKGWIDCVERSDDGRFLASAGRVAQVIVWDWSGRKLRTLTDFKTAVTVLAVSPDGRIVAASGKKARPLVWSLESGKVLAMLDGHDRVTALRFSADSRRLVSAGPGRARIWNVDALG